MDIDIRDIAIRDLRPNSGEVEGLPRNPRKISKKNLEKLKKSVQDEPEMLRLRELIVVPHGGVFVVIAGNQRLEAAKEVGMTTLPCKVLPEDTDPAKLREYAIKDNLPFGEDDWEVIASDWDNAELEEWGMSVPEECETKHPIEANKLKEEFMIPPLSIVDASKQEWIERKKDWLSLGIKSEDGRACNMLRSLNNLSKKSDLGANNDESIFDPVLCELIYLWFCKKGGVVLDPFAGGSVRGIVASFKDMHYTGIDIRKEQVDANYKQINICENNNIKPSWICNDSAKLNIVIPDDYRADLIFSCPPYADLEQYSDIEGDISNMSYDDFKSAYRNIIKQSCDRLNNNRFACFVVGEVRDKKGVYRNFVSDTISAFQDAGMSYYNEIILKTNIAAKALTCAIGMRKTRKIGKIHQNILVFIKGDPRKAVDDLGDIKIN